MIFQLTTLLVNSKLKKKTSGISQNKTELVTIITNTTFPLISAVFQIRATLSNKHRIIHTHSDQIKHRPRLSAASQKAALIKNLTIIKLKLN